MPVPVFCPVCGAEATDRANAVLAQEQDRDDRGEASEATVGGQSLRLRLRQKSGSGSEPGPVAMGGEPVGACAQHPSEPIVARCGICGAPICRCCAQAHGAFCSARCRAMADQQGLLFSERAQKQMSRRLRLSSWPRRVCWLTLGFILTVAAHKAWWRFVGYKPRVALRFARETFGRGSWDWVNPGRLLFLGASEGVLRKLPEGWIRWRIPLQGAVDQVPELIATEPWVVWLHKGRIVAVDAESGQIQWQVRLPTPGAEVRGNREALAVVDQRADGSAQLIRVELASGAVQQLTVPPQPRLPWSAGQQPGRARSLAPRIPTAGDAARGLADEGLEETSSAPLRRVFMPSRNGVVEFQVWLIESNVVERAGLRPRREDSILEDPRLSAGRSWGVVREALEEIERLRSGGVVREDRSRYGVRLRRWMAGAVPDWMGEVIGPPLFFALHSVDVVWAGTNLMVFNGRNQLLWQATLAHPAAPAVDGHAILNRPDSPCTEIGTRLIVADQGMLSCFDSASGRVHWRMPMVGTRRLVPSPDGHELYAGGTSGTIEDLRYPLEPRRWDKLRPLLIKLDVGTGRVAWRREGLADHCALSGSVLYAWWLARGISGEAEHFHLHRINPLNGSSLWHLYEERWPRRMRFQDRWFLLEWDDGVEVWEFRS